MNISYNWLKRYLDADISAERMAEILTELGLEVEEFEKIETIKGGLKGVVVGEVLTCEDHPDSDHLHITTVDVGAEAPLQIVCGAANCRKGLKVCRQVACYTNVRCCIYTVRGKTNADKVVISNVKILLGWCANYSLCRKLHNTLMVATDTKLIFGTEHTK